MGINLKDIGDKYWIWKRTYLLSSLLLTMVVISPTVAQSEDESMVGKSCPDYIFNNVHYYKTQDPFVPEKIDLKDFRGKWVILDFWTRNCEPCVKSFPTLNQWQKDFGKDVQFILVGSNDKYNWEIESYYAGVRTALELELTVAFDSVLYKKLKVYYVPYMVIIDPNGIVREIAPTKGVTKESIAKILKKEK